jgi:hypothetical protein
MCGGTDTDHCAFSAGSAPATQAKYLALLRRLPTAPQSAQVTYAQVVSDTGSALESTAWQDLATLLQQVWTTGQESTASYYGSAPVQSIGQTFAIRCSESPNPGPAGFRSLDRFA